MLRSFAKQIWNFYIDDKILNARARYLWDSCSSIFQDSKLPLYLDIGTGSSQNTLAFSCIAKEIVGLDLTIPANNVLKKSQQVSMISGDGMMLPLNSLTFDAVSLFSFVEYATDQYRLLHEVFRVSKPNSIIIVQMPNRFFPVDPHNGVPFIFLLPKRIRNYALKTLLFEGVKYRETPSLKNFLTTILKIEPQTRISVKKIHYPDSIILPKLRTIYRLLTRIGLLDLIPIGYIIIIQRQKSLCTQRFLCL